MTKTLHLSHADRNHILEVLEDNQTNLMDTARSIRRKMDASVGVSMPSYPVDLSMMEILFLQKEIQKFQAHSRNIVLKHLAEERLKAILTQTTVLLKSYKPTPTSQSVTMSLSKGTAREALKSAFIITVLACLVVWAVIETVNYYSN